MGFFRKKSRQKDEKKPAQQDTSQPASDNHPIPLETLDNVDMIVKTTDGSTELSIICSGYLDDSDLTHQRILDKISNYLFYIQSDDYKLEFGDPSPESTYITLNYSQAHDSVFNIVDALKGLVAEYGATLRMTSQQSSSSETSVQPGETEDFDFVPMEEIAQIAEAYSEDAIEAGKEFFDVDLDWTKESISRVSDILNLLHKTKKKKRPSKEDILMQAEIYGSYVGEVYRRHYPAEWGVVKLGEENVPALKCKITGAFFFPWGKAQQQIMNGDEDNVAVYYHILEQEVLPKLKK